LKELAAPSTGTTPQKAASTPQSDPFVVSPRKEPPSRRRRRSSTPELKTESVAESDVEQESVASEPEDPPPNPVVVAAGIQSDSDSDDPSSMPDITFSGKSADLDAILTHCEVTFRSNKKKYADDDTKSAYLASTFRGPALDWLTQQFTANEDILDNYTDFKESLRDAFQASLAVQKQTAERKLKDLRQKASALDYVLKFEPLADLIRLNDEAKQASFKTGLKLEVQRQLLTEEFSSFSELRDKAIDVDEALYAMRPQRRRKGGRAPKPTTGTNKRITAT